MPKWALRKKMGNKWDGLMNLRRKCPQKNIYNYTAATLMQLRFRRVYNRVAGLHKVGFSATLRNAKAYNNSMLLL